MRAWLRDVFEARVALRDYAFALAFPVALFLGAAVIHVALFDGVVTPDVLPGIVEYPLFLGFDSSTQGLKAIGERIYLTERFYNQQLGFTAADDLLPERFYTEAGSSGDGIEVPPIDRTRYQDELRKYYRMRGLDEQGRFTDPQFLKAQP